MLILGSFMLFFANKKLDSKLANKKRGAESSKNLPNVLSNIKYHEPQKKIL